MLISCSNDMQVGVFRLPNLEPMDRYINDRSDFKDNIVNLEGHKNTIRMVKIFNSDKSIATACDDS